MTSTVSTAVALRRLPDGPISVDDFELVSSPLPALDEGDVLTRTRWFSIDPIMRKRMLDQAVGGRADGLGQPIGARTLDEVVASRHPSFRPGDLALGWGGWRDLAVQSGERLVAVEDLGDRTSYWLSALGRPGITAWLGVEHVAQVTDEDVLIVSSAAGAVGSVAAQLARSRGAAVIGIAGGAEKTDWLTSEARLAAAVDYKAADFTERLASAIPSGATAVFECVGGRILDESIGVLRPGGRIALCGLIDRYQGNEPWLYRNFNLLLERGIRLEGFRIDDHQDLHAVAVETLRPLVDAGEIVVRETVADGLSAAPQAFVDLLEGRGAGKHLVRVAG